MPDTTQNCPDRLAIDKTDSMDLKTFRAVMAPRPGTLDLKESRKVKSLIRQLDAATGKIMISGDAQGVVLEIGPKLFPFSRLPAGRRTLMVKRTLNRLPDYGGAALEALNQLKSIYYQASSLKDGERLADLVDRPLMRIHTISKYFPHDGRDVRTTLIERVRILILVIARTVKLQTNTQNAARSMCEASPDNDVAPPSSPKSMLANDGRAREKGDQKDQGSSPSGSHRSKKRVSSGVSKGEEPK